MRKIITDKREHIAGEHSYKAWLADDPSRFAFGVDRASAIGELILAHRPEMVANLDEAVEALDNAIKKENK